MDTVLEKHYPDYPDFVSLFQRRVEEYPHKVAYRFLKDGEVEHDSITYATLSIKAQAIAARLQALGKCGDRTLLLYPQGLEFIAAFLGCLYAGMVAIPSYLPRPNRAPTKLQNIMADAEPVAILTREADLPSLMRQFSNTSLASLPCLATDNLDDALASTWQPPLLNKDTLAFLQYTSGSTGTPKGVMVSHNNILYNSEYIRTSFKPDPDSVCVTWLPAFHDMGLIAGIIQPLYVGASCFIMPPVAFLQRPARWLQVISRYKATHSGGPNFGYELCIRQITPEQREQLDLSSWCSAYNGAEPVRRKTLEQFSQVFANSGFRPEALYPCYGMAETTLFVTGGLQKEPPVFCTVQAEALRQNKVVVVNESDLDNTPPGAEKLRQLVGCGHFRLDTKLCIVDPDSLMLCPSEQVGEIWVSGPTVAQGYWRRTKQTQETFDAHIANTGEGPFLRTGDLGFIHNNELFITGRLKDIVIIRGRNYYPNDIELTVEECDPAMRNAGCAAFSIDTNGEEQLVIVQEIERTSLRKFETIAKNIEALAKVICKVVAEEHDLQVSAIEFIKPATLPKTSSGKVRRSTCRASFLEGSLSSVGRWEKPTTSSESVIKVKTDNADSLHSASAIQDWIIQWLSQQLGRDINTIKPEDAFAEYGLDSFQSVQLTLSLEDLLGYIPDPGILWYFPTIEELATYLSSLLHITQVDTDRAYEEGMSDLHADTVLDDDIRPTGITTTYKNPAPNIFLTGATGFLGAFLLYELIKQASGQVYCLVRANSTTAGMQRLRDNLQRYGLWQDEYAPRITPILGDLEQPKLGLAEQTFQQLGEQIDVIYHNAAQVNFIYPYPRLKAVNVTSTKDVLRLAMLSKIKPVHHISTIAVFESWHYAQKTVDEKDPIEHTEGMELGYSQSKWVAEQLILKAGQQGLPVSVYRPPLVSGHSETGAWNTDDFTCRFIKACIQMGYAPDLDYLLDIAPVDYVSKAIVYLSLQTENQHKNFHLVNPRPWHWREFLSWLQQTFGYAVRLIPYVQWQEKVKQTQQIPDTPLHLLLPFFLSRRGKNHLAVPELYEQTRRAQTQCEATCQALAPSGITCPAVNSSLMETYFATFLKEGFLQK